MSVKFFGQFLIERGEIDAAQLREGLDLMKAENLPLGQVAVREGFLSQEDADRVNAEQRGRDRPFGVLAVELGLLSSGQLDQILAIQKKNHLYIGEALVRLGYLQAERLGALLDEFKLDQAPYETGEVSLPEGLAGNRLATLTLDFLPKFAMRISRLGLKIGAAQPLEAAPDFEHQVGLRVSGTPGIEMILLGDREFARHVAAGTFGVSLEDVGDDMISDGMGEFLNILAGNAVSILERDGGAADMDPPNYCAQPGGGWLFEVVTTEGRAGLVLVES